MTLTRIDDLIAATDFGAGYTPEITELSVARTGGVTWLYGHTSNPDDGFITMRLSNNADLTYITNTGLTLPSIFRDYDESDPTGFDAVTIDGDFYLVGSGYFTTAAGDVDHGLHYYEVQANGELAEVGRFSRAANKTQVSEVYKLGSDVLTFEVETNAQGNFNKLYVNEAEVEFDPFRLEQTGTPPAFGNADVFGLAGDEGDVFFFYTRTDTHKIAWISFTASGTGLFQGDISGSGDLGATAVATDMESVMFGDQGFLITTNPTYGLRSYDIDDFGGTTLADTVGAGASIKDWEAEEIATFKFEGRNFVATGGKEIAVFEIDENGEFYLQDRIDNASSAGSAFDIEVHAQGGNAYIIVSGDDGVSSYKFEPGPAAKRNGTPENDVMIGDDRNNVFSGFNGNDVLKGAGGNDVLYGNKGRDDLFGGKGNDTLRGADGTDELFGGNGRDDLDGQKDADTLFGGTGDDRLKGDVGADKLVGGKGGDVLYGGNGADLLNGSTGKDILVGGGGSDTFVMSNDGKTDRINDWQDIDTIALKGFAGDADFDDLKISEVSPFLLRVNLDGQSILLRNGFDDISASDLTADHFDFG